MKSFVKELRDAAMQCPDVLIRKIAKDIADEIQMHCLTLNACPNADTLKQLNGAWVRAVNILAKATPTPDNNPRSGAGEAEQERMAA